MSDTFGATRPRARVIQDPAAGWRRRDEIFSVRIYSDLMRYIEERAIATHKSKGRVILEYLDSAIQREKALAGEEQVDA